MILVMQIRMKFLQGCDVDLVLCHSMLEGLKNSEELKKHFRNVIYLNNDTYKLSLRDYLCPRKALKKLLGREDINYDDLYFWNPDWCFYFFWKSLKERAVYHLYADAEGGYLATPQIKMFGNGLKGIIARMLDNVLWNFEKTSYCFSDVYMFRADLIQYESKVPVRDVPQIGDDTICKLNKIWEFYPANIDEQYLFVDTARGGMIDATEMRSILRDMSEMLGEKMIIKPHPRTDMSEYDKINCPIMDKNIPWELFCMNGGTENKTLLGVFSSAFILPYLMNGTVMECYLLFEALKTQSIYKDEEKKLYDDINAECHAIHFVDKLETLKELIDENR